VLILLQKQSQPTDRAEGRKRDQAAKVFKDQVDRFSFHFVISVVLLVASRTPTTKRFGPCRGLISGLGVDRARSLRRVDDLTLANEVRRDGFETTPESKRAGLVGRQLARRGVCIQPRDKLGGPGLVKTAVDDHRDIVVVKQDL